MVRQHHYDAPAWGHWPQRGRECWRCGRHAGADAGAHLFSSAMRADARRASKEDSPVEDSRPPAPIPTPNRPLRRRTRRCSDSSASRSLRRSAASQVEPDPTVPPPRGDMASGRRRGPSGSGADYEQKYLAIRDDHVALKRQNTELQQKVKEYVQVELTQPRAAPCGPGCRWRPPPCLFP